MKPTTVLAGMLVVAVLGGCGGEKRAAERELVEACREASTVHAELCECVAKKAVDQLSPSALALLRAGIKGDEEKAAALMKDMSMEETTEAGMMMAKASQECAQGMADDGEEDE